MKFTQNNQSRRSTLAYLASSLALGITGVASGGVAAAANRTARLRWQALQTTSLPTAARPGRARAVALAERIAGFSTLPFLKQRPAGGAEEVRRVLASLYYDLAGSASDGAIERLRRLTSLSHILFGSDYPFTPAAGIDANVEGFRTLSGLTGPEHEAIARGNALRLVPRFNGTTGAN